MRISLNSLRINRIRGQYLLPVLLACALIALSRTVSALDAPVTPTQLVEQFHGSLLAVMKDAKRLGYRGRLAVLTPEIARAFHLPVMTRIVAGRHWKKMSKPEKQSLVTAFSRMTTATYAHRFSGYDGERFRMVKAMDLRKKAVMIKTELIKSDGSAVKLDYLLKQYRTGWRVIDIYLDGSFSVLATRRSEYSSVLRRKGLDALIGQISKKVAQYAIDDK